MHLKIGKLTALAAALLFAIGLASPASAQIFTGRVDVTLEDSTGGRLPGVSVDIAGPVNQSQVTDAQGQAHFLSLPVGQYTVKANLAGFNPYTNDKLQVVAGASVPLAIRLAVAGTAETVNVSGAAPVIDTKKETTTTNVTLEELQGIPSARDPWVVMQTVPTIYVDRVNVGGSESGQQSNYIGKGSVGAENTWNLDGVPITDMGATGSTPTYYNFDMFQEMAVTTGGSDAAVSTPGVQLNMVLKKGSNSPHGAASAYWEGQSLQATNLPSDLVARLGGASGAGNRTDKYLDTAFDVGGPILKDKLWAWGSMGRTNVKNITLTGAADETFLLNYALKADAQVSQNVRANFTFYEGNKEKFGRSVGPTRLPETGWNQSGPTKMFKGEMNFVVGQNFFIAGRYAQMSGGFGLHPAGGMSANAYQDADGVWHGSYVDYSTDRPQYYGGADGNYFVKNHEIKFGFSYRKTPVDSASVWPGSRIVTYFDGYPGLDAQATQDYIVGTVGKYTSFFATDTISMNKLTVILGLRYDRQTSSLSPTTTPAVAGFEKTLPAKTVTAVDNAIDYKNFAPRAGITYALNDSRKSIMRASYAMFASQLGASAASFISPAQYSYTTYGATDRNGNKVADLNEVNFNDLLGSSGYDPANPGRLTTANKIDPNLTNQRTQELMFGVDHELMPNFGVSATFTYRYSNNFVWSPALGAKSSDYTQSGTFTGTFANVGTVSVPYYKLSSAVAAANQNGLYRTNRPDYHQKYMGFELSATKRMSNRWMARFGFASSSWTEYFDNRATAIMDPTPTPTSPLQDGGPVVISSSGSGKSGLFLVAPKYQISANGLYQGPWGIDFGANMVLRQGYAEPWNRTRVATGDPLGSNKTLLLASSADAQRLPTVTSLDVRLEKRVSIQKTNIALMFDVFNVANNATVLGIQYDARVGTYNQVLEIMNPRIARLGVRFYF